MVSEEPLTGCRVIDSSGCHRYEYWNEQSLFDGRPDTGWCSPSRSNPAIEHLLIETNDERPVVAMEMLSRSINERAGFPGTIEVLAPANSIQRAVRWRSVHRVSGLAPPAGSWVRIDLPPTISPLLLLRLSDAGIRPDGKQFTQLMCLQIFAVGPR